MCKHPVFLSTGQELTRALRGCGCKRPCWFWVQGQCCHVHLSVHPAPGQQHSTPGPALVPWFLEAGASSRAWECSTPGPLQGSGGTFQIRMKVPAVEWGPSCCWLPALPALLALPAGCQVGSRRCCWCWEHQSGESVHSVGEGGGREWWGDGTAVGTRLAMA